MKKKIACFSDLFIGLFREEKGSCYEAPILKPKPMRVTDPEDRVDYNEFHRNIQKQLKQIYYDTKRRN